VLLCAIVLFEPRGLLGLINRLVRRRGRGTTGGGRG
jgi:hypothetical protein